MDTERDKVHMHREARVRRDKGMRGGTGGGGGGRRAGRRAVWMVLIALAAPAWAQDDYIGKMERQVEEIVSRSKPAVVSVRVGPRRLERSFAPHAPDLLFETPLLFD